MRDPLAAAHLTPKRSGHTLHATAPKAQAGSRRGSDLFTTATDLMPQINHVLNGISIKLTQPLPVGRDRPLAPDVPQHGPREVTAGEEMP